MNSRFDEAVEQILDDLVILEADPGMASLPGAQKKEEKPGFWKTLATNTLKSAGTGLGKLAANTAGVLGTGLGLTQGVGSKVVGGVGTAVKDAYTQSRSPEKDKTTQSNTSTAATPTKTVANIIPTIQPQKINSTISNFPKLNADKNHLQTAIPNMLRGLKGNYSAQDLVQMVTGSIPPGSQVRQIASNNAAMNKINTDLQNYLMLNDKERAQLKAQIPALLRGIKSTATIEDVGQLLTNVLA
jgi:hypothetical protein